MTPETTQENGRPASLRSGPWFGMDLASKDQWDKEWESFAKIFRDREGFDPNPKDSRAKDLFFWFQCGGHPADKARLDWLDAQAEAETFEDAPHALAWTLIGEPGQRKLRAAIDAAMASERAPTQWGDEPGYF